MNLTEALGMPARWQYLSGRLNDDRVVRNHFAEAQPTSSDWAYRMAERLPETTIAFNQTGGHVPKIGTRSRWAAALEMQ
jgi:hypothetical protein